MPDPRIESRFEVSPEMGAPKSLRRRVAQGATLALVSFALLNTPCAQAQAGAGASAAPAQAAGATPDLPSFEVAAIKPNKSGSMMMRVEMIPDGISITGLSLHMLLREALGVSNDRLLGEPGWVSSARYDIEAKVDAADAPRLDKVTMQQRWAMMLPLLEERFGLKFHHETKNEEVYALVLAKGGSKLKQAVPGDTYANGLKGPDGAGGGAGMMLMHRGELTAQAVPIANLVRQLSLQLGSTIVDKTGLTGNYDFTLQWAPDEGTGPTMMRPEGGPPSSADAPPPDATGPSLFTALQEQLGLKLEARKEPVDVIVIDHIEQPSPN